MRLLVSLVLWFGAAFAVTQLAATLLESSNVPPDGPALATRR